MMTPEQIKAQIQANNLKIRSLVQTSKGVLNYEVAKLIQQNRDLQNMCPHTFENGLCVYCDKQEIEVVKNGESN